MQSRQHKKAATSTRITDRKSSAIKLPWQKSIAAIPDSILMQVAQFKTDSCVASCAKKLKISDIEKGTYAHLGITMSNGVLEFPNEVIPPAEVGKYSRWNREVREIVHKDQPKIEKTRSILSPNYGDWFKGSHLSVITQEVYPRSYQRPKLSSIRIKHIADDFQNSLHVLKFTVEEVLDRTSPSFMESLLVNLNLLQENVGNYSVFSTDASPADYLHTLYVNWEILPPGEREETLTRILSGIRSSDPQVRNGLTERYEVLRALKPRSFIRGTNGFRNYFGAIFADDLVVFETVEYGNAIYILFEEWETLSKRSRTDLLNSIDTNFVRILHSSNWKARLKAAIQSELKKHRKGV